MGILHSIDEVKKMLDQGKSLFLAGDENLLMKLPKGKWIAGTIPYFMADTGGTITDQKIFVDVVPEFATKVEIKSYDEKSVSHIYSDGPENGFSMTIIPATSKVHLDFAMNAPKYESFAAKPLVGWISGVHLKDLGKISPKVFDGSTGEKHEGKAVVMHVHLPANKSAEVKIINIFKQGDGDTLEFPETGFSTKDIIVNGKKENFADYIAKKKLDLKQPVSTDFYGAIINTSFQNIDEANKTVNFYAPVFKGLKYKHAAEIKNYVSEFTSAMPKSSNIFFTCNCILNFLYAELEGKKTGTVTGPITFGEVAYQLLNQTMVYLEIHDM